MEYIPTTTGLKNRYVNPWFFHSTSQLIDQQQQLNQQYADAVGLGHVGGSRRRRLSADNHHLHHFKSPLVANELLSRSDGAAHFKSPPLGGVKRKRMRPDPLVIPPNLASAQTRLRSPRICEAAENPRSRHPSRTPPPYTPPPILSPIRSGTGLFHGIYRPQGTPSTAPSASTANLSTSLPAPRLAQLKHTPIPEEDQLQEEDPLQLEPSQPPPVSLPVSLPVPQPLLTFQVKAEAVELTAPTESLVQQHADAPACVDSDSVPEVPPAPVTDTQPHINIGTGHQATLPTLRSNRREAERDEDKATLMWTPECLDHCITVQELTAYMDLSRSAAVPGCGSNQEYALHQLYYNKGDIRRAILALMSKNVSPQFLQFIQGYHYQNSDLWSPEDIQIFRDVIARVDKDFISITKEFKGRKTHKQCVEFYYFWKKVCIDEYKRLGRKRKYNLRSRRERRGNNNSSPAEVPPSDDYEDSTSLNDESGGEVEEACSATPSPLPSYVVPPQSMETYIPPQQLLYHCDYPECAAVFNSKPALNGHAKVHVLPHQLPQHSGINPMRTHLPPPSKKVKSEPSVPPNGDMLGADGMPRPEFPCKLCGKVFYKVKSRSAHMKSHSEVARKAREAAKEAKQRARLSQL
ncbi:hypothetical protein EB796_006675 [Bugula neritina]|uniref:Uncharacterized protein n=1 Tax=Bugula neritina TaxID=10212 RepID=A0A7J7K8Q6_BUGNE|nr:hypothetical protein EB796_006675 [Bugula neritina]